MALLRLLTRCCCCCCCFDDDERQFGAPRAAAYNTGGDDGWRHASCEATVPARVHDLAGPGAGMGGRRRRSRRVPRLVVSEKRARDLSW